MKEPAAGTTAPAFRGTHTVSPPAQPRTSATDALAEFLYQGWGSTSLDSTGGGDKLGLCLRIHSVERTPASPRGHRSQGPACERALWLQMRPCREDRPQGASGQGTPAARSYS